MAKLIIASLVAFFTYNVLAVDNIPSRYQASCGYVGGRIYCYGGDTSPLIVANQPVDENLFYLDINSFANQKSYAMGSRWNKVVPVVDFNTENRGSPASVVLSDGKRFLIQGGFNVHGSNYVNQTIIYDTSSNMWSSSTQFRDGNGGLKQVHGAAAVSLPNDSVGFYGGSDQFSSANPTFSLNYVEDVGFDLLTTLNIESGIWSSFSPQTTKLEEFYPSSQTAILNPNTGKIYYLGGSYTMSKSGGIAKTMPLSWAPVFNTVAGLWSTEQLHGDTPSARMHSTFNFLPNSQDIILYGGIDNELAPSGNYCYTLNLETNAWTWKDNVGVPDQMSGPRYLHSAVLVNVTLFILFGRGNNDEMGFPVLTIDVSNVSNIVYTDSYVPTIITPKDTYIPKSADITKDIDPKEPGGLSKGAIGGIIVGAIVAGIIAFILLYLLRRNNLKRKYRRENIAVGWNTFEDRCKEVPNTKSSPPDSVETNKNSKGSSRPKSKRLPDAVVNIIKPSVNSETKYTAVKPDVI